MRPRASGAAAAPPRGHLSAPADAPGPGRAAGGPPRAPPARLSAPSPRAGGTLSGWLPLLPANRVTPRQGERRCLSPRPAPGAVFPQSRPRGPRQCRLGRGRTRGGKPGAGGRAGGVGGRGKEKRGWGAEA